MRVLVRASLSSRPIQLGLALLATGGSLALVLGSNQVGAVAVLDQVRGHTDLGVSQAQIEGVRQGSPEKGALLWLQAAQQRDLSTLLARTRSDSLVPASIGELRALAASAAGRPLVVSVVRQGRQRAVRIVLVIDESGESEPTVTKRLNLALESRRRTWVVADLGDLTSAVKVGQ